MTHIETPKDAIGLPLGTKLTAAAHDTAANDDWKAVVDSEPFVRNLCLGYRACQPYDVRTSSMTYQSVTSQISEAGRKRQEGRILETLFEAIPYRACSLLDAVADFRPLGRADGRTCARENQEARKKAN